MLPPAFLVLVGGIHVLGTNRAAVRLTQRIKQLAQTHRIFAEKGIAGVEYRFLIGIAEPIKGRIEFRNVVALGAFEGIQVSPARADIAVGSNNLLDSRALTPHFGVCTTCNYNSCLALLGTLCKSIDDRQMGNVFGIAAICCWHMLQSIEILAPAVGNAAWIG